MAAAGTSAKPATGPLGLIALNLGGPSNLDDVEPFLRRLFGDPDVIQLGWLRPLQPLFARMVAKRRAPFSRDAYAQIGGRSPILEETRAQAQAVADVMSRRGITVFPVVAMAAWHPLADEALAALKAHLANDPGDPALCLLIAEVYARQKEEPMAAESFFLRARESPAATPAHDYRATNRLIDLYLGPLDDQRRAAAELERIRDRHAGTEGAAHAEAALRRLREG